MITGYVDNQQKKLRFFKILCGVGSGLVRRADVRCVGRGGVDPESRRITGGRIHVGKITGSGGFEWINARDPFLKVRRSPGDFGVGPGLVPRTVLFSSQAHSRGDKSGDAPGFWKGWGHHLRA
jgi:hypothetical protein